MSELKKKYKSLLAIPIKVEMQPVEHASDRVIPVEELGFDPLVPTDAD